MAAPAPAQRRATKSDQTRALVDEYADLQRKLAPYKKDLARLSDIAISLRAKAAKSRPTRTVEFKGERFMATLGPCGMETRIKDMDTVFASLGRIGFLTACSMTLKALEAAGGNLAALTVKEQTGSRSITVSELPTS